MSKFNTNLGLRSAEKSAFVLFGYLLLFLIEHLVLGSVSPLYLVANRGVVFLLALIIWSKDILAVGMSLFVFGISVFVGSVLFERVPDVSWDGNTYHMEMLLKTRHGESVLRGPAQHEYTTVFPKNGDILMAGISMFSSDVTTGRSLKIFLILTNLILIVSVLGISFGRSWKGWGLALLLGGVLVGHPVILYQFFTHYIDDIAWHVMTMICLLLRRRHRGIGLMLLAVFVGIKHTMLFFGICIVGVFLFREYAIVGYSLKKTRGVFWEYLVDFLGKKYVGVKTILFFVALGIVGLTQYMITWIHYGSPAYPILGENKDIVTAFMPAYFASLSAPVKLRETYRYLPANNCRSTECLEPIDLLSSEGLQKLINSYKVLTIFDPNISGFGGLFFVLLVGTFSGMLFFAFSKKQKTDLIFFSFVIMLLVSVLVLPSYWARFIPQRYVFPLLMGYLIWRALPFALFKGFFLFVGMILYLGNTILIAHEIQTHYTSIAKAQSNQDRFIHALHPESIVIARVIDDEQQYRVFLERYANVFRSASVEIISLENLEENCGINSVKKYNWGLGNTGTVLFAACPAGGWIGRYMPFSSIAGYVMIKDK